MKSAPKTIFAGSVGPDGDKPGPNAAATRTTMYIIAVVLFPVAVLSHFVWQLLFYYARMKWWVPSVVFGVFFVGGFVTGNITTETALAYIDPWRELVTGNRDANVAGIGGLLLAQVWLGFLLGTGYSAVASAWKWQRRPAWQERHIVPGLFLRRRAKKTAERIASGTDSPMHGVTVGVAMDTRDERFAGGKPRDPYGSRVVLSDTLTSSHVFVSGGSGTGKTSTMLVGVRDVIRLGRGVVIVDCKGGADVPQQLAEWAHRYGRTFRHWLIQDPQKEYLGPAESPAYYDPISRGDASRRKDLLIGSFKWDVDYYRNIVAEYVQTAFQVMALVPLPNTDTFTDLSGMLNVESLLYRAKNIPVLKYPQLSEALSMYSKMDDQARSGLYSMYMKLRELTASTAGNWLRYDRDNDNNIDLRRAADEGEVIVFSLDTSEYEEVGKMMAGLIVQDLKTLSSELRHNPAERPLHLYVDEFSAVEATNILGLLSKARDAQIPVTIATQALSDLASKEPAFLGQVLGIVGCFLVHRPNTEDDARIFAGLSGMQKKVTERTSIQQSSSMMGSLGAAANSGMSYLEEKEEASIGVGEFQNLKRGQCVLIAKNPELSFVNPIQVVLENTAVARAKHDPALPIYYDEAFEDAMSPQFETYIHPALERKTKQAEPLVKEEVSPTFTPPRHVPPVGMPGTGSDWGVPTPPPETSPDTLFVPPYASLSPKPAPQTQPVEAAPAVKRPSRPQRPQTTPTTVKPADAPLPPVGAVSSPGRKKRTSPHDKDNFF